MAVAVDVAASEKARQEVSPASRRKLAFKKGKWTEAIGHYTNATVHNPNDPLGYANRAQAYLKLEKWADADRDCTTALSLPSGKGNVKALYRRALARKELDDVSGAKSGEQPVLADSLQELITDLEEVLRLEPGNGVAKSELADVSTLMKKKEEQRAAKGKGRLPPSPPRPATALANAAAPNEIVQASSPSLHQIAPASSTPESASHSPAPGPTTVATPNPATSFADLRRSRESRSKKSFAASSVTKSAPNPTEIEEPKPIEDPLRTPKSALPRPDISVPGAGLQLLRSLTPSASDTWTKLSVYPPDQVGKLLDGLLEPDSLGRLCLALHLGALEGHTEEVRQILGGLKRTSRWGMNVAMLDAKEREAGQAAWSASGGEGSL